MDSSAIVIPWGIQLHLTIVDSLTTIHSNRAILTGVKNSDGFIFINNWICGEEAKVVRDIVHKISLTCTNGTRWTLVVCVAVDLATHIDMVQHILKRETLIVSIAL